MKKAVLILTLLIATVTFSACGGNSTNTGSSSNKTQSSSKKSTKLATSAKETPNSENDSNVITDIDNWSHPVKAIFNAEDIKINKVEFKDNKTYATFYVNLSKDLNSENKSYYLNILQKIASANSYWDYEIKDENKDIDIKVKCNKDKKSIESIDYNKDSNYFAASTTSNAINKDELIDYLKQNVTEVSSFVATLSKNKNVKPILYVERSPKESSSNTYLRDYYVIYVGEQHSDHNVNTYRFAINKNNKEILYYDTTKNKYETLDEWRNGRK